MPVQAVKERRVYNAPPFGMVSSRLRGAENTPQIGWQQGSTKTAERRAQTLEKAREKPEVNPVSGDSAEGPPRPPREGKSRAARLAARSPPPRSPSRECRARY